MQAELDNRLPMAMRWAIVAFWLSLLWHAMTGFLSVKLSVSVPVAQKMPGPGTDGAGAHRTLVGVATAIWWVMFALNILIGALVTRALLRGRNWSRIVVLIVVIVAALAPLSYVLLHAARDLETFWRVGLLIVDASLIALLFIGPGSAWFARPQRS